MWAKHSFINVEAGQMMSATATQLGMHDIRNRLCRLHKTRSKICNAGFIPFQSGPSCKKRVSPDWFMVKKRSKSIVKYLAIGRLGTSHYEIHFKEKLKMVEMYVSRPIFSIFFQKQQMK
ncbi:hypothetical protein CMK18_03295 [Candidatus Poribacteria bacterium]|nr:hypothetical protein [Candidatus Poribacteria bacterium]